MRGGLNLFHQGSDCGTSFASHAIASLSVTSLPPPANRLGRQIHGPSLYALTSLGSKDIKPEPEEPRNGLPLYPE
jgi:hypothetical protein